MLSNKYQFYNLWLEPTMYCTRGEHANYYTTDAGLLITSGEYEYDQSYVTDKCWVHRGKKYYNSIKHYKEK